MRQTKLVLSAEDREKLERFRAAGVHHAREVNRAHILLALDGRIPEATIRTVLGVGRTAIWRTRSAYCEKGLEYALHDAPRSGAPREYPTDQEAKVVALACSQPPAGAKRWTIQLLTQAARAESGMQHISRESIRRFLKKTSVSLGAKRCGASAS
jgi:transposase